MMTWDEHFRLWAEVRDKVGGPSRDEADRRMAAARDRVKRNTPDDWRWLAEALGDPDRRHFVALVFRHQQLPKRLFAPMIRAAVTTPSPAASRWLIGPCARGYGGRRVLEHLLRYLEEGTDAEKAGAVSAMYWVQNAEAPDLWARIDGCMLREFVANADLEVRRQILPSLKLAPAAYPDELRPLVSRAIEIARSHPDEFIRHRVEVQLGANVPLTPIPTPEVDRARRASIFDWLRRRS